MMKTKWFIYIALFSDIAIAVTKFIVAGVTHSSAMLSESIHSVIDVISQLLLLWGVVISKKKPDDERPFGYGRELYFWAFIVSLIIFTLGGCISFYEGLLRLSVPPERENQTWSYVVLSTAFIFTAISAYTSYKAFNKRRVDESFWRAVQNSKDPSAFIIMLGDMGDLVCLAIAFAGIYLGHLFNTHYYDGIASMLIGAILVVISALLVKESRSLLMGETVSKSTIKKVIALAEANDSILKVKKHFSVYLAPEEIVLQLTAVFKKNLSTQQITSAITNVTKEIQHAYPRIKQIFIEPVEK